jgi:hypothetical protein
MLLASATSEPAFAHTRRRTHRGRIRLFATREYRLRAKHLSLSEHGDWFCAHFKSPWKTTIQNLSVRGTLRISFTAPASSRRSQNGSATRREHSLEEAPAAITVMDGKEVADAASLTLADILRRVPGAWASP